MDTADYIDVRTVYRASESCIVCVASKSKRFKLETSTEQTRKDNQREEVDIEVMFGLGYALYKHVFVLKDVCIFNRKNKLKQNVT